MTLVAKHPGLYTIDAVCITAFNPGKGIYEKICSQPVELSVQKGSNIAKTTVTEPGTPTKKTGVAWYWLAAALVVLGIASALLARRKKKAAVALQEKAGLEADSGQTPVVSPDYARMAKASLTLENNADFMNTLKKLTKEYMAGRTEMDVNEPYEVLLDEFAAKEPVKAVILKALTAEIDYLLYAPGSITTEGRNILVNGFLEMLNS